MSQYLLLDSLINSIRLLLENKFCISNDETCFAKVAEFLMTVHFVITQTFSNITSMVIIQL